MRRRLLRFFGLSADDHSGYNKDYFLILLFMPSVFVVLAKVEVRRFDRIFWVASALVGIALITATERLILIAAVSGLLALRSMFKFLRTGNVLFLALAAAAALAVYLCINARPDAYKDTKR